MELTGKTAVVTGAAVRVGRAIALRLARDGADLLIHYHTHEAEAATLADEIRAMGRQARTVRADLAEPDAADRLLDAADAMADPVALVNNASIYAPGTPDELGPQQMARLWQVNVVAPTLLAERFAARMASANGPEGSAGRGSIVNILDAQARRPWPRYLAYCMSKGALWTATTGLARALAPAVRVNGVAPGIVLWNEQDGDDLRGRLIEQVPLKSLGRPQDVAAAVSFLCTARYITGQVLHVDGGRVM